MTLSARAQNNTNGIATVPQNTSHSRFVIDDVRATTSRTSAIASVIAGLQAAQKRISSMYLYDAVGSKLFETITKLPEYYPSHIERDLLKKVARQVGATLEHLDVVEIGSGDCSKISLLFSKVPSRQLRSVRYVPVDVSRSALEESARILTKRFPSLRVHGLAADFSQQLHRIPNGRRRLFCFLGGTVGNLEAGDAVEMFTRLASLMENQDRLLLGIDMVKDKRIIERAYNDNRGITAAFNRNIVNPVNKLLASDFDPSRFRHLAFYNDSHSRIEMHLQAETDMTVTCPYTKAAIQLCEGETIHTENSHKFTSERIGALLSVSGLRIENRYTDDQQWYSLLELSKSS